MEDGVPFCVFPYTLFSTWRENLRSLTSHRVTASSARANYRGRPARRVLTYRWFWKRCRARPRRIRLRGRPGWIRSGVPSPAVHSSCELISPVAGPPVVCWPLLSRNWAPRCRGPSRRKLRKHDSIDRKTWLVDFCRERLTSMKRRKRWANFSASLDTRYNSRLLHVTIRGGNVSLFQAKPRDSFVRLSRIRG